ncbi:hypothetical protein [Burkholderia ubonensis]|uniref:hypothetical protein n=1 Tax=Burkholderia ubonensis TaxID=101571 RepID=UPI000A9B2A85|nr:hypothetical protein [Burkholderia ubonensis]
MSDMTFGRTTEAAIPIYAGRCVSRTDVIALVAISASRSGAEWTLVRNPDRLFPRKGLVEIRGAETKSLRENDWVALQIVRNHGNAQVHYKGAHHWRLFNYLDLSHLGSIDDVRAALKIDGVPVSGQNGTWVIRTRQHEVIKAELVRSGNLMRLASSVGALAVYPFGAEGLLEMPEAESRIQLYDLSPEAAPTAVYDWTPDEDYITRVLKSLPGAYDARVDALVKSLLGHAETHENRIAVNPSDVLSAYEALRSGELAKALLANRDRIRELAEALQSSPVISRLIEKEITDIAEHERAAIQARLQRELHQDMGALRDKRLAEINQELQTSENEWKSKLDLRIREDELAQQRAFAKRRTDEEQKLKQELGDLRAKREVEIVREVEDRKDQAQGVVNELSQQRDSLSKSIAVLENEKTSLEGTISTLTEKVSVAERQLEDIESRKGKVSAVTSATLSRFILPVAAPNRAEPLLCKDVHDVIQKCALLTPSGKKLMEHFVTLMLAADVPILKGPQVDDFLRVAEVMFSSGARTSLVADPTIICVEDLWVRAGLRIPTSLGLAMDAHADDSAPTTLAIVDGAENSAARYWYPALAEQARRGNLPRKMLFCVTIGDGDNDEAHAMQNSGVTLDVNNAIDGGAPALAAVLLSPKLCRDLRPDPWISDLSVGASLMITSIDGLTIDSAMRATRACLEASRLSQHASASVSSVASLFKTSKN